MKEEKEAVQPSAKAKSVAATIHGEFFNVLEKQEGFGQIAPRLRKTILEDGVFAEPAVRSALFPDAS